MKTAIVASLVLVMLSITTVAGVQDPASPSRADVMILKLGHESVTDSESVVIHESVVDLVGHAVNGADRHLVALVRRVTAPRWLPAGSARVEPGGIFRVLGMRFPGAGTYEVVVVAFSANRPIPSAFIDDDVWRGQAEATSKRLAVSVAGTSLAGDDTGAFSVMPSLRIASVGRATVRTEVKNVIPAAGDVILDSTALPDGALVYLARRVPYTDRCTLLGPARATATAGQFILSGVTVETPGDPQQMHFELSGFASKQRLRTGEASCDALRYTDALASLPVEVIIEAARRQTDDERIAHIAITRVGVHVVDAEREQTRALAVRSGVAIEVAQFERVLEGDRLYFLTRQRGSRLWLAQGPALRKGLRSTARGPSAPTWVWIDLRFETTPQAANDDAEFEVLAVLSTALFPNAVVDSTFPSSKAVHGISQMVRVRVEGLTSMTVAPIAIESVAAKETEDASSPITVGESGTVLVNTRRGLPPGMAVYVVRHKVGGATYSLFETLVQDARRVVPDLSFINPHPEEGAEYQLFAIAVWGKLAMTELTYEDLLNLSVGTSKVVPVRYSAGRAQAVSRQLQSWRAFFGEKGDVMFWLSVIFLTLIVVGAFAASFLVSRRAPATRPRFPGSRARSVYVAFGLGLFAVVVYAINEYYLEVYPGVIATVAELGERESEGLAVWLVIVTALLGVSIHLSFEYAQAYAMAHRLVEAAFFDRVGRVCAAAAVMLWCFQGGLYFEMLSLKSFGLTPLLGGIAFALIAVAETVVFFLITKLVLPPLRLAS